MRKDRKPKKGKCVVLRLVDHVDDGRLQSVKDMLEDCLSEIEEGTVPVKKAITIFLDDDHGEYIPTWYQAGMSIEQMISLLDNTKFLLQKELLEDSED
jgi:hypothetical protein